MYNSAEEDEDEKIRISATKVTQDDKDMTVRALTHYVYNQGREEGTQEILIQIDR